MQAVSNQIKRATVMVHDVVATMLAVALSLFLRWPVSEIGPRYGFLVKFVPLFLLVAALTYRFCGLYRSKWRFASLPDLFNIFKAATILALLMLAADYALIARDLAPRFLFGEKGAFLYWVLQMFLLGGPRLAYRYLKYAQSRRGGASENVASVVVLGRGAEAEVVLRALEGGLRHRFIARAVLSPRSTDFGVSLRGVPVLGGYDQLDRVVSEYADNDSPITRLIFAPSEFTADAETEQVLAAARRLAIPLLRMQTFSEDEAAAPALAPVEIEDLLFRPTVDVDREAIAAFLRGKRVLVTGGGGSIGSELCLRVAAFGASDLMVLDQSEPALHAITEQLAAAGAGARVHEAIADVRDRPRVFAVFEQFRPDVIFHAAALKQLPYLERDWSEGVKTNVFGSVNVTDAAAAAGARALVVISTDKAVDPVSILGATKRFSEIYAQTCDSAASAEGAGRRVISVRFGNVLGSVGSVVPKFKAQIARGGPVTVTHPDMVRYFMTVREACDLVLTASGHSLAAAARDDHASVYVLKMGHPARIVDLAQRMIRLAGHEPGKDMQIVFTGVREGERLNEYLFASDEPSVDIGVNGVTAARTETVDRARVDRWLAGLARAIEASDRTEAERLLGEAIPAFRRAHAPAQRDEAREAARVTDISAARRGGAPQRG